MNKRILFTIPLTLMDYEAILKKAFIIFVTIFFIGVNHLEAEELDAKEIVQRADQLMRGDTNVGVYEMTIITPKWQRNLKMQIWEKGREKMFIRITYPPKEKNRTFLKIGCNMWNYIPEIERNIRIPPSMMMQSWMGSDFKNDDLVKASNIITDYEHAILGVEKLENYEVYKIRLTPHTDAPVVWGKIIYWVRKEGFIPVRREFYSEEGKLKQVMRLSEIKNMHGRVIPTCLEMQTLDKQGHRTIMKCIDVQFNLTIDDNIFTIQNLR